MRPSPQLLLPFELSYPPPSLLLAISPEVCCLPYLIALELSPLHHVAVAANLDPPQAFFEQGKANEDEIRMRSVLTCPPPRVAARIAVALRLVCALTAASPTSYLSPVVAVGLKHDVGNK